MFQNLQIRTVKSQNRKSSMVAKAGIAKRRVSLVPITTITNVPSMSFMKDLFGDEFPEAFESIRSPIREERRRLIDLPPELLSSICYYISKSDIKRLRLTSKRMARKVGLHFDRVYISPNRANLKCLREIMQREDYRNQVREIVWDDAQLEEYSTLGAFQAAVNNDERQAKTEVENRLIEATSGYTDENPEYHSFDTDDFFSDDGRLSDVAKAILLQYDDHLSRDTIARNAVVMTMEDSYRLYQQLYHEERDIIEREIDIKALRHVLSGFPNIRRITLTSEVWRPWNLYPRYDTPFYRSLPPGFRKPSVWPWFGYQPYASPAQQSHRDKVMSSPNMDLLAHSWRGYHIVVSALLDISESRVEELIIDVGKEKAGLPYQLFTSASPELDKTIKMLQKVPLKRLHLALNSHSHVPERNKTSLFSGYLRQTLGQMRNLEHLDLNLNLHDRGPHELHLERGIFDCASIYPENLVPKFKTIALRNIYMFERDLCNLLVALEQTEYVVLDNVWLVGVATAYDRTPSWARVFDHLRQHYSSSSAIIPVGPKYTWTRPRYEGDHEHRCILLEEEIDSFLYSGGESPFTGYYNVQDATTGWIVDDRDSSYKVNLKECMQRERSCSWQQLN